MLSRDNTYPQTLPKKFQREGHSQSHSTRPPYPDTKTRAGGAEGGGGGAGITTIQHCKATIQNKINKIKVHIMSMKLNFDLNVTAYHLVGLVHFFNYLF